MVIALALGLIGNFVYQKVEIVAVLWFIVLVFAVDLFFTTLQSPKVWLKSLSMVVVILVIYLPSLYFMWPVYCSQHAALMEGELKGADAGIAPNSPYPWVQVGTSKSIFIMTPDGIGKPYFAPFSDAKFWVEMGNQGPLVSTTVRNRFGEVVVEVSRNHWVVYPSYSLDKNSTSTALEVKDSGGHVVLQLKLTWEHRFPVIQVQGEWWNDEQKGIRILTSNGVNGEVIPLVLKNQHNDELIGEIFEYPSKYHWKQLRGCSSYSPLRDAWNSFKSMILLEIKYLTNQWF